jgi:hypothetical protein
VHAKKWYGGQLIVTLKDSILQPSTPLQHAAEMHAKIASQDLLGRLEVGVFKTDGGPDRNTTFVAVQLAAVALARRLDLPALVLMRTAPGQSYVNPVERTMSVLNLAGQGMALVRT